MQERVCGAPNRWETARAAGNLPTPGREEARDGKSRCAAKSADCHIHTCATAFPSLWQLLCQSGELIMGKQICSPPSPTHTQRAPAPIQSLCLQHHGPQEPGAASRLPGAAQRQKPGGKRHGRWMPSRLSSCCPGAPAFTPAASSQPHQSTYDNSQMPPNRKQTRLQSPDQGGRRKPNPEESDMKTVYYTCDFLSPRWICRLPVTG